MNTQNKTLCIKNLDSWVDYKYVSHFLNELKIYPNKREKQKDLDKNFIKQFDDDNNKINKNHKNNNIIQNNNNIDNEKINYINDKNKKIALLEFDSYKSANNIFKKFNGIKYKNINIKLNWIKKQDNKKSNNTNKYTVSLKFYIYL